MAERYTRRQLARIGAGFGASLLVAARARLVSSESSATFLSWDFTNIENGYFAGLVSESDRAPKGIVRARENEQGLALEYLQPVHPLSTRVIASPTNPDSFVAYCDQYYDPGNYGPEDRRLQVIDVKNGRTESFSYPQYLTTGRFTTDNKYVAFNVGTPFSTPQMYPPTHMTLFDLEDRKFIDLPDMFTGKLASHPQRCSDGSYRAFGTPDYSLLSVVADDNTNFLEYRIFPNDPQKSEVVSHELPITLSNCYGVNAELLSAHRAIPDPLYHQFNEKVWLKPRDGCKDANGQPINDRIYEYDAATQNLTPKQFQGGGFFDVLGVAYDQRHDSAYFRRGVQSGRSWKPAFEVVRNVTTSDAWVGEPIFPPIDGWVDFGIFNGTRTYLIMASRDATQPLVISYDVTSGISNVPKEVPMVYAGPGNVKPGFSRTYLPVTPPSL